MKDETQHRTLNIPCPVTAGRLVYGPGYVLSVTIPPLVPYPPVYFPQSRIWLWCWGRPVLPLHSVWMWGLFVFGVYEKRRRRNPEKGSVPQPKVCKLWRASCRQLQIPAVWF
jgi:hypothetical protein